MIILGVDPGTVKAGYAIITPEKCFLGVIYLDKAGKRPARLLHLYHALNDLFQKYEPSHVAVETQYIPRGKKANVQSAFAIVRAATVVEILSAGYGCVLHEVTPSQAKAAVTGKGNASKSQVARHVELMLRLKKTPVDDAADAYALAKYVELAMEKVPF